MIKIKTKVTKKGEDVFYSMQIEKGNQKRIVVNKNMGDDYLIIDQNKTGGIVNKKELNQIMDKFLNRDP